MRAAALRLDRRVFLALLLLLALAVPGRSEEGGWTALSGGAKALDAWKEPTGTWMVADQVAIDPENPKRLVAKPGTQILVNGPTGNTKNLISKQSFGDIELHLEFLVPQRSNSGVKFEGLYEIQIFDSWGVKNPTASDCGGIYPRVADAGRDFPGPAFRRPGQEVC
jgi:hypothetical protein